MARYTGEPARAATAVPTVFDKRAAGGSSLPPGMMQATAWVGGQYVIVGTTTPATVENRPGGAARVWSGGPHPSTLGLWRDGDALQSAVPE